MRAIATRLSLVAGLVGLGSSVTAQVTVRGVAYDSLRNAPLAAAFVTLGGGVSRSAISDSVGRFQFDSVPPGAYTVSMQHANLDSLGLPGVTTRAVVGDGHAEVQIAIPSFATVWHAACGPSDPPRDSGFVYGVTRDASTQRPVRDATIDVSWVETTVDKDKHIAQRLWRSQTRSDATGSFGACGIPSDVLVRVQASADSTQSGGVDFTTGDPRVRRRDLYLGPVGGTARGTVVGTLTGAGGSPFRDARILLDSMPEARSNAEGRFTIRDVAAGTRQMVVTSIGMEPVLLVVDVFPRDTALVTAEIRKAATTLAPVNVKATARRRQFERELAERTRSGFGSMRDSSQFAGLVPMWSVFDGFAGARVVRPKFGPNFSVLFRAGTQECQGIVFLDGRRSSFDELSVLTPQEVAVVEVYPRRSTVPTKFMVPGQPCGVVAVWTKFSVP